eukprot:TRINITY_DN1538_c0_g1_i2.p1 TRINITY_DN1538_c0_g1~~TRINITY_DN1538_c0_g1_i2.p1  ORF type:complete len:336 (+),score=70.69 TRINITY_DN1538_c0_g1_i2:49-1056(+)
MALRAVASLWGAIPKPSGLLSGCRRWASSVAAAPAEAKPKKKNTEQVLNLVQRPPVTPGMRFCALTDRSMLWRGRPPASLTAGAIKKKGGRNCYGRITVRHRGGGHKRIYRIVDFKRKILDVPGTVQRLEYDPNRNAHLALISYPSLDNKLQFIIAPQELKPGDSVICSKTQLLPIAPGNCMPLSMIPIGTEVHNVELKPGRGGQVCRAAGTSATILDKDPNQGYALLRFRSREYRRVTLNCMATLGIVSNPDAKHASLGKAGRSRWMGRRPHVRGTAMNPVDHPHGGGHGKDSGGRKTSLTPWGVPCKGKRTRSVRKQNKLIVKRRFQVATSDV